MKKYKITNTMGDNCAQYNIFGEVKIENATFAREKIDIPSTDSCVIELYYRGVRQELVFTDDTIANFYAFYALTPDREFTVWIREDETGRVHTELSAAAKHLLNFLRNGSFVRDYMNLFINSTENKAKVFVNPIGFDNEALNKRYMSFVFFYLLLKRIVERRSMPDSERYLTFDCYAQLCNGREYCFVVDIDKDKLQRACENSSVIDFGALSRLSRYGYYVMELDRHIILDYILSEYFRWLGNNDDIVAASPELTNLNNFKIAIH